jgi:hypothetical protein
MSIHPELALDALLPHDLLAVVEVPACRPVVVEFRRAEAGILRALPHLLPRLKRKPAVVPGARDILAACRWEEGERVSASNGVSSLLARVLRTAGLPVPVRCAKRARKVPGSWLEAEAARLPHDLMTYIRKIYRPKRPAKPAACNPLLLPPS